MQHIVNIYKPRGLSPGQLIQEFRIAYPQYAKSTIGYAGRLDPLAHGVMLLMIDEATKTRDNYLNLPKTYEFEAVFGLETDTYDVLGFVREPKAKRFILNETKMRKQIETFMHEKLGKHMQSYPPFSSKAVNGKPLFWWAKQKKLAEITIPEREIEIYEFKLLQTGNISTEKLQEEIQKQISSVSGDFRQQEIGERWGKFFAKNKILSFPTARFHIAASSGTYVRSLVYDLGKEIGCGATTLEILRTKVGTYTLNETLILTQQIL